MTMHCSDKYFTLSQSCRGVFTTSDFCYTYLPFLSRKFLSSAKKNGSLILNRYDAGGGRVMIAPRGGSSYHILLFRTSVQVHIRHQRQTTLEREITMAGTVLCCKYRILMP